MAGNNPADYKNNCNLLQNNNDSNIVLYQNYNKNKNESGPPDLDELFRNFNCKLHQFGIKINRHISLVIAAIIIAWFGSGLYTIKEAERGVVLRFGKFHHLVQPGLNWKPTFIDKVTTVNVESVRELAASGIMLTSDENVVHVEMNVQYRIIHPKHYLFNVINPDESLRQATDSALRGVIGKYTMDRILTEGRTVVRSDTRNVLEETIHPYNMGIELLDVNFQTARPPEEVKAAFDDAIAARENEQQYIREAEAYANEVRPYANGKAQRVLEESKAYKIRTILEAQGKVQKFIKVLPEYKAAPKITRERLYIDVMEKVLSNTNKILINNKTNNNILVLPLEHILHNTISSKDNKQDNETKNINTQKSLIPNDQHNTSIKSSIENSTNNSYRASSLKLDDIRHRSNN